MPYLNPKIIHFPHAHSDKILPVKYGYLIRFTVELNGNAKPFSLLHAGIVCGLHAFPKPPQNHIFGYIYSIMV